MEIVILPTPEAVARQAARLLAGLTRTWPGAVLGLATGETQRPVYRELVRLHREEGLRFAQVTTFNLDEYVGLSPDHPASYHFYMRQELFDRVDLEPSRVHLPDGLAADVPAQCAAYEAAIEAAGGIDLQLLGLGRDGHIGFNEPSSSLTSRTRIKTLADATLAANRTGFAPGEPVPRHVITMGVGTILEARRCLVVAHGRGKAEAVARMVEGPLTAMVPASALQLHPSTTVLVDEEAASLLSLRDYYRSVYANKPTWQRED